MSRQGRLQLNWLVRYSPIISLLDTHSTSFPVLDVGSGAVGIASVHDHAFVGCDLQFDNPPHPQMHPVVASAVKLPFPDRSFSTVACIDVLEHVSASQRSVLLRELLRVARCDVLVAFPSGETARRADTWVSSYYRTRGHALPGWLQEHMDYSYPCAQDVEREIECLSLQYERQGSAAWPLHVLVMILDSTRLGPWLAMQMKRMPRATSALLRWINTGPILGGRHAPYRLVFRIRIGGTS